MEKDFDWKDRQDNKLYKLYKRLHERERRRTDNSQKKALLITFIYSHSYSYSYSRTYSHAYTLLMQQNTITLSQ